MGDMNDRDPFEDLLRQRAPGPRVSDTLLDRIEKRAWWSNPPARFPLVPILVAVAAIAICLWLAFPTEPASPPTQPPVPPAREHPLSPAPAPLPPVAARPDNDFPDRTEIGFYSATLARTEPAFHGGLDLENRRLGLPREDLRL